MQTSTPWQQKSETAMNFELIQKITPYPKKKEPKSLITTNHHHRCKPMIFIVAWKLCHISRWFSPTVFPKAPIGCFLWSYIQRISVGLNAPLLTPSPNATKFWRKSQVNDPEVLAAQLHVWKLERQNKLYSVRNAVFKTKKICKILNSNEKSVTKLTCST